MNKRIEFHTHTVLSDGAVLPSELIRRAYVTGHEAIALTDHVDFSNIDSVISAIKRAAEGFNGIEVLVGAEVTHVVPEKIGKLVEKAKILGAQIVIVHGETVAEPVAPGTNKAAAAISDVNIIAHPGFISEEEVELAKQNGIYLELTARCGHNITNGHVAKLAQNVLVNTDCHGTELITASEAEQIACGAGLKKSQAARLLRQNASSLLNEIL
ncbi:MAG TPA: histidinol phosphate phosphatase domain-containing protein [Candidatus Bathyarchaeia archaeon]|nr:histidinol phosphate phosphatase domain-containing protein [Candidatus Bathyarchaeia archaeon]